MRCLQGEMLAKDVLDEEVPTKGAYDEMLAVGRGDAMMRTTVVLAVEEAAEEG